MSAWYLPLNAVGGQLLEIPLSGAAAKGGNLMFCATWSIDAGDGIDDKIVFVTDLGEVLIFTGSDPSDATGSQPWHQEGRYMVDPPMGMNAHMGLGGDLLIMKVSGIVPVSAAITKSSEELELAAITRQIRPMWRDEVVAKRQWSWTMENWTEYGGVFVTWPGGTPGNQYCAVVNASTGAWCRYTGGWDATCFLRLRADLFFGTQDGRIVQAERGGYDDGKPYVATLAMDAGRSSARRLRFDVAAGAGLVLGDAEPAVSAAALGLHRLRRGAADAAATRHRHGRRQRRLGRGQVGA